MWKLLFWLFFWPILLIVYLCKKFLINTEQQPVVDSRNYEQRMRDAGFYTPKLWLRREETEQVKQYLLKLRNGKTQDDLLSEHESS